MRATPGVNAPNDGAGPSVNESVAGTVPLTGALDVRQFRGEQLHGPVGHLLRDRVL